MNRHFLSIATLLGALSVVLGAFGAHTLRGVLSPESLAVFETGVRYQFYHVFALFIVAFLSERRSGYLLRFAGNCFITGIILFSGSLYALTAIKAAGASGLTAVGILTPIGGLFLIAGWLLLFFGVIKKPS